jgi:hypothetical protein
VLSRLKPLLDPFEDEALTMWPVDRQKVREVAELDALSGS